MLDLHMLSQIPSSCLYIQLSVLDSSKNFDKLLSVSCVSTSFCTDETESIEWPTSCTTTAYK